MTLFGRLVEARVTAVNWTRTTQLERRAWVARRGTRLPPDEARHVQKHMEEYWPARDDPLSRGNFLPGRPGEPAVPWSYPPHRPAEPRIRVYYTYEVQEWRNSRLLRASGDRPGDVRWPEYAPEPGERVRHQVETYMVTFAAAGKRYDKSLPELEWQAFAPGDACRLTLGLLGGVKKAVPARG